MSDAIDLSAPIETICEALGFNSYYVKELRLTPKNAQVTVYRAREDGSKYVDDETNEAAVDVVDLPIRT